MTDVCRYCKTPLDELPRKFFPSQVVDPTVCNGCRYDDFEDYAGITRQEAAMDEAGVYEPSDLTEDL